MENQEKTSTTRIEVRYAETDQMGVVHHSVYAVWFEQARTDFFRKVVGTSYAEIEKEGFVSPVLELNVRFRNSTHYGEFVDVETSLVRESKIQFRFNYKLTVEGKLCATGSTLHCFVKNGMPTRELPKSVEKLLEE